MKVWKSLLLLTLVFVAGVAVGIVGTRVFVRQVVQAAIVHPERAQMTVERNFTWRLQLDTDQQTKLHSIMADTRKQLAVLRRQYQPQVTNVLRDADQKISALLDPGQQARYDKIKDKVWPALQRLRNQPAGANSGALNSN